MLTKIKEFVKKIEKIEWIVLGIALTALVIGLTHGHAKPHKASHNEGTAHQKAVEKTAR